LKVAPVYTSNPCTPSVELNHEAFFSHLNIDA